MTVKKTPYRGLLRAYLAIPGVLAAVAAFNYFADPYGIHDPRNAPNAALAVHGKDRIYKARQVNALKPQAVILGSSRASALSADHPGWSATPVFNLALPASVIYEDLRYFQHAHAARPLRQVVLGLDLLMFNGLQGPHKGFAEERLNVDRYNRPLPWSNSDWVASLLSVDALKDSYETIVPMLKGRPRPDRAGKARRRPDGAEGGGAPLRPLFQITELRFMAGGNIWFPSPRRAFSLRDSESGQLTIEHYRQLLALAYRDDIDLRLFISPVHARLLEAKYAVGLWPTFERWKRLLVETNEQAAQAAGKPPFPLWDFSGYNSYTTEAVPLASDPVQRMRWYRESSHYTRELGDRILDRVLETAAGTVAARDSFGVRLTSATIERHLARIRAERRRYLATHPADVREVEESAEKTRASRRGVID